MLRCVLCQRHTYKITLKICTCNCKNCSANRLKEIKKKFQIFVLAAMQPLRIIYLTVSSVDHVYLSTVQNPTNLAYFPNCF